MWDIINSVLGGILTVVTLLVFLFGLFVIFLKLPGGWVIFFAILINDLLSGMKNISILGLLFFLGLAILMSFMDNIASIVGARKSGAGKWGIIGAILGALVGLIFGSFFGMLLGPFIGAFIFEVVFGKKDNRAAVKAGVGASIGFLTGILLQFIIGVVMVVLWISWALF